MISGRSDYNFSPLQLANRIYEESNIWTSTHEDETKILKLFSKKFHNTLINQLNNWTKHTIQEIFDKISEEITLVFKNKIKLSSQIIKEAILILESLIKRQDDLSQNQQTISSILSKINALMAQNT